MRVFCISYISRTLAISGGTIGGDAICASTTTICEDALEAAIDAVPAGWLRELAVADGGFGALHCTGVAVNVTGPGKRTRGFNIRRSS